jgi:hypothetical protein
VGVVLLMGVLSFLHFIHDAKCRDCDSDATFSP